MSFLDFVSVFNINPKKNHLQNSTSQEKRTPQKKIQPLKKLMNKGTTRGIHRGVMPLLPLEQDQGLTSPLDFCLLCSSFLFFQLPNRVLKHTIAKLTD